MPDYRSILTEGLPPGNMVKALMLTDAGVQGSGKRWFGRSSYDEIRAADVFRQSLANSAKKTFKKSRNPYFQQTDRTYYHSPGLGADDYDADMAEAIVGYDAKVVATAPGLAPPPTGGSSSGWADVLQSTTKILSSGVASGLTNLIGGRPSTMILSSPSSGMSMGAMLAIGAAVLGAGYLVLRKR